MSERDFGELAQTFIGIVTNVNDPHQSGRVQVRVFGRHSDVANIPDADLPWAQVLQPVTSAARGRMGTAPVGMIVGSRVYGNWLDRDHQYPLILGTVGRAGEQIPGVTENGAPAVNTDTGSIPAATQASANNAYASLENPQRVLIQQIDSGQVDIDSVSRNAGIILTEVVENNMTFPKAPTTGSVDQTDIDVLIALRQVDPNGLLASLSCFIPNALQVSLTIDLASIASGFISMLGNAIIDALLDLADRLGINNILNAINAAAAGIANFADALNAIVTGGICAAPRAINSLSAGTQSLAYAVGNVQKAVAKAGNAPNAIREVLGKTEQRIQSAIATAAFRPIAVVDIVPLGYIQEYYTIDNDPYPGYIRWVDPTDQGSTVFTLRNGQPNYASAEEQTRYETRQNVTSSLGSQLIGGAITTTGLNSLLNSVESFALQTGIRNSVGSGFNLSSVSSMIRLIPLIHSAVTGNFTPKISVSILPNSSQISQAMNSFASRQAILERRYLNMQQALRTTPR